MRAASPEKAPEPVLPDYRGACISRLVPALSDREADGTEWLPRAAREARQLVLLVLDGLGWDQLAASAERLPNLSCMAGGPIASVVPTTTATALTSISTGLAPSDHGVVGYRVRVGPDEVMNVLRWRTSSGDARQRVPPGDFQPVPAFGGEAIPAVTRAEFAETGFTIAHLTGARLIGWRMPSTLRVEVRRLVDAGEPFVYAYYDGLDKVAHEWGLGAHFAAELEFVDRLVGDLVSDLPDGAVLVVTSDHGQVMVGDATITIDPSVMADVELLSGEGRFRWLHARPGKADRLVDRATDAYGDVAWVRSVEDMVTGGWFGGPLARTVRRRLGDVALVAHAAVSFNDPADTGEVRLVSRHGSLTAAEMWVPLLAGTP